MKSPAHELAIYLEDQGVGVFAANSEADWSISVDVLPDRPNRSVALRDEGGGDPDTDELDIQTCNVAIRVRSLKQGGYLEAYEKQVEIRELLIHTAPLQTDNMYFLGARMVGNISSVGRDDNDRFILMATYELQRQLFTPEPDEPVFDALLLTDGSNFLLTDGTPLLLTGG